MVLSLSNYRSFILYALQQWTFSIKGQRVNICSFVGHVASVGTTQLCHCQVKAARDNTQINGWGYVAMKLDLSTMKSEFHIIFTCHQVLFFLQFLSIIKKY